MVLAKWNIPPLLLSDFEVIQEGSRMVKGLKLDIKNMKAYSLY